MPDPRPVETPEEEFARVRSNACSACGPGSEVVRLLDALYAARTRGLRRIKALRRFVANRPYPKRSSCRAPRRLCDRAWECEPCDALRADDRRAAEGLAEIRPPNGSWSCDKHRTGGTDGRCPMCADESRERGPAIEDPLDRLVRELPPLAPLPEVCRFLGNALSVRQLRRRAKAGSIATFRTSARGSGRLLISRDEVRRLLGAMKEPGFDPEGPR